MFILYIMPVDFRQSTITFCINCSYIIYIKKILFLLKTKKNNANRFHSTQR